MLEQFVARRLTCYKGYLNLAEKESTVHVVTASKPIPTPYIWPQNQQPRMYLHLSKHFGPF